MYINCKSKLSLAGLKAVNLWFAGQEKVPDNETEQMARVICELTVKSTVTQILQWQWYKSKQELSHLQRPVWPYYNISQVICPAAISAKVTYLSQKNQVVATMSHWLVQNSLHRRSGLGCRLCLTGYRWAEFYGSKASFRAWKQTTRPIEADLN